MNIVKDDKLGLNSSPMEIYFLVDKNESPEKAEFIGGLNDDFSLTRGIFKFRLFPTEQDEVKDIKNLIGENNMFLRLIENLGEEQEYLVDQINLNQGQENILKDIRRFLMIASRQDIHNIHKRINSYSPDKEGKDNRIELFGKFALLLQNLIKEYEEKEKSSIGNSDANDLKHFSPDLVEEILKVYPSFVYDVENVMKKLSSRKNKDKSLERLCVVIQDILGVKDFEGFKKLKNNKVKKGTLKINIPEQLYIYLPEKIDGTQKKSERKIKFPIYLGGKKFKQDLEFLSPERGVLYAMVLAAQREGWFLKRSDFVTPFPNPDVLTWMESIFKPLNPNGNFSNWYKKISADEGHPLSMLKSHTSTQICTNFGDYPQIVPFIDLISEDKDSETRYRIILPSENIGLPNEHTNNEISE